MLAADQSYIAPSFHGMKAEEQEFVIEKVLEFKKLMCGIVGQINLIKVLFLQLFLKR